MRYIRTRLPWQEIDNEILIITPKTGEAHELNATAAHIYKFLDDEKTSDEVCKNLCEHFAVDPASASDDCELILNTMAQKGLLEARENH